MERIERFDRWFVDAVDRFVRPVTTLTGRDGGTFAVALAVAGSAALTVTIAQVVRATDPADLRTLALVIAILTVVAAFDLWSVTAQVRRARRAAADGLLVTDPHQGRRLTWLALPALVVLSLPLATTAGLMIGSVSLAAAYAAAARCRPPARRTRRRMLTIRALRGAPA